MSNISSAMKTMIEQQLLRLHTCLLCTVLDVYADGTAKVHPLTMLQTTAFNKKSIGIGTAGTIEHTVKDAAGISHIIRFSYADTISLPVVMTIQTDALLPELYVKPIAEAVVSFFQQNRMGQNVYPVSVCAAVLQTGLAETVTELAFTESGNLQTPWIASAKQIAVCTLQQVYIRNGKDAPYYHVAADETIAAVSNPWEAMA